MLASFIDGRLISTERETMIAHLVECPECYEAFREATGRPDLFPPADPPPKDPRKR